jgi:hypothetical protein
MSWFAAYILYGLPLTGLAIACVAVLLHMRAQRKFDAERSSETNPRQRRTPNG